MKHVLFTIILASLLTIPIIMVTFANYLSGVSFSGFVLIASAVFSFSFFMIAMSIPLNALTYHLLLKLCGAQEGFEATLRVFCYYMPASVVVLPCMSIVVLSFYVAENQGLDSRLYEILSIILLAALAILIVYYGFYVLLIGFSKAHRMSMKRVIFAIIGIPLAINIVIAAIPTAMIFVSSFDSSEGSSIPSVERSYGLMQAPAGSMITAPYGSSPVIDGYYTSEDGWNETQKIDFITGDVAHSIAAKHDDENLYILLRWEGDPVWQNSVMLYFEQDGDSHDHVLSGPDDYKYTGASVYGPSNFCDAHQEGGVREEENGMVAGNYSEGFWVQEWIIPLRSGNYGDIYVEHYPTVLGFAFADTGARAAWPVGARSSDIGTWGDLEITE